MEKFVDEINELLRDGIQISERHFNVSLKCIVCDTPARAFIKSTVGHGGKYACERCTIQGTKFEETEEGERINLGRTVYPDTDCEKRTDTSFRNMTQREHHYNISPLTRITPKINMITAFILDFMHLCCLGIMKKLISFWLSGDLKFRLGVSMRSELGRRMEFFKKQVCSEFQRKPRSTKYYPKWKAPEFRLFLLYCGPIVLKSILSKKLYKHFLLLYAACRILSCRKICFNYLQHAKKYLKCFFVALKYFYGPASQIMNAHNLLHLADDVRNMDCSLSQITAFPFENVLGKIKRRLLRTSYRLLVQVCRRLHEEKIRNKCGE